MKWVVWPIVAVVLLILGTWLYFYKMPVPSDSPIPSQTQSTSVQYSDMRDGIAFSYPNSWYLSGGPLDKTGYISLTNYDVTKVTNGSDAGFPPDESKIEVSLVSDLKQFYYPDVCQPVVLNGHAACKSNGDLSYAFQLSSAPEKYIAFSFSAHDNTDLSIYNQILQSLTLR